MKLILDDKNRLSITKLEDNWHKLGKELHLLFRGYFFYNGEFYFEKKLPEFILNEKFNPDELNGCFALLLYKEKKLKIILDRLGSIPLFYQKKDDAIIIYDRLYPEDIPSFHIDEASKREFLVKDLVSGENTLFKEIKEFDNATLNTIYFEKNNLILDVKRYWRFRRAKNFFGSTRKLENEYLNILDEVFKDYSNVIKKINKPPYLFLSTGMDSRLIAFGLKKWGLNNLKTITFLVPNKQKERGGIKVAELLNLENTEFNLPVNFEEKIFGEIKFAVDYLLYAFCFRSVPIVTRLYCYHLNKLKFPKEGIFIEGHAGGDFLTGPEGKSELETSVRKRFINSVRFFEWIGADWITPLCDHRLFDFYEKIPRYALLKQRFYTGVLRKYFSKEILEVPKTDGLPIRKRSLFFLIGDLLELILLKIHHKYKEMSKGPNNNYLGREIIKLISDFKRASIS